MFAFTSYSWTQRWDFSRRSSAFCLAHSLLMLPCGPLLVQHRPVLAPVPAGEDEPFQIITRWRGMSEYTCEFLRLHPGKSGGLGAYTRQWRWNPGTPGSCLPILPCFLSTMLSILDTAITSQTVQMKPRDSRTLSSHEPGLWYFHK